MPLRKQQPSASPVAGVVCSGKQKHFFCAQTCVKSMVSAQLPSIQAQGETLLCPVCKHEARHQ